MGEPSGLSFLDKHFKIRPGFFYTCTGWPLAGKSELVMNLALLQAQMAKRKVAIYSPESYPVEAFIATMAHWYLGKATDRAYSNVCTSEEYESALDWLNEWVYLLSYDAAPDHLTVLEDFKTLHSLHDCRVFVLDPFNSLTEEDEASNMATQLKNVLNTFILFTHAEKVIFFCVEHPRTPKDGQEAKRIPGPYQMFGGSMWWNKSDCLFAIHALTNDQGRYTGEVLIKVWKMKNQKLNGFIGQVSAYFDVKTNRYFAMNPDKLPKSQPLFAETKDNGKGDLPF